MKFKECVMKKKHWNLMKKKTLLSVFTLLLSGVAFTQPCMEKWHYRTPITLNNTTNPDPLVDYQLKFILNTDSLINEGLLRLDAGDLRFTNFAGGQLPFWIVNNTLNTTKTEIWVNVDNIPPLSNIDIFMFYGNQNANSVENGDATFLHYDNFDGAALDFGKWTFCAGAGGGTIPVVASGEVSFASSSATYNHSITSLQTFTGAITTEMKVNSTTTGIALLAQTTPTDNGYGMALEKQTGVVSMRLVSTDLENDANLCLALVNQTPVNNVAAGTFQGLWSFTWSKKNEQLFSWSSGNETRTDFLDSSHFNTAKNVVIGSFKNTGAIAIDYVYTRKYSPIVPAYSYGAYTELVDKVEATSNSPFCVQDTLKLFAPYFQGAVYNWVGPNGFVSTDQNPVVNVSQFIHVGKYIVRVSAPTNCSVVMDSVIVKIDSVPVGGTLLSDITVCKELNNGTLNLVNQRGNITHWESANTAQGPWNTISTTNSFLNYNNLLNTQHYRSFVEYGFCGADTSNKVTVTVNEASDGGGLLGGNVEVCSEDNLGQLKTAGQVGNVQFWQQSIDNGNVWDTIHSILTQIKFVNLTSTSLFRVSVKNGDCISAFSDTTQVIVHPLPKVNFSADTVCKGFTTEWKNLTTIQDGFLKQYEWNFGDGNSSIDSNVTYLYRNGGVYNVTLKAISGKGCIEDTTIQTQVYATPEVDFSFTEECIFVGTQFENASTINEGTMTYQWKFGDDSSSNVTAPLHTYGFDGYFPVQLITTSNHGCVDSLVKLIQIHPLPLVDAGPDVYLSYGFTTEFMGVAPTAAKSVWSPGATVEDVTSLITGARPLERTTFTLNVTNEFGCENLDKVTIHVLEDSKVIPTNVITPNGDGINDTWVITNADAFNVIKISVYDRWGLEIFSAQNYSDAWDGTVNFDELPEGTYYYFISFDDSDKEYSGTINLLR